MKCSNVVVTYVFFRYSGSETTSYLIIRKNNKLLFKIFRYTCKLILLYKYYLSFIQLFLISETKTQFLYSLNMFSARNLVVFCILISTKIKIEMVRKITIMQELFLIQALLSKLSLLTAMKSSSLYSMFEFIETSPGVKM